MGMDAGKRLRIYLDTSVVSNLVGSNAPEQMEGSSRLWLECMAGGYEVFVSPAVLWEIGNCPDPKRGLLLEKMGQIGFVSLEETDEVRELAAEYAASVLTKKHIADCLHIAYAVAHDCDLIVSWNFDHIVNDKTRGRVIAVPLLIVLGSHRCGCAFRSAPRLRRLASLSAQPRPSGSFPSGMAIRL